MPNDRDQVIGLDIRDDDLSARRGEPTKLATRCGQVRCGNFCLKAGRPMDAVHSWILDLGTEGDEKPAEILMWARRRGRATLAFGEDGSHDAFSVPMTDARRETAEFHGDHPKRAVHAVELDLGAEGGEGVHMSVEAPAADDVAARPDRHTAEPCEQRACEEEARTDFA